MRIWEYGNDEWILIFPNSSLAYYRLNARLFFLFWSISSHKSYCALLCLLWWINLYSHVDDAPACQTGTLRMVTDLYSLRNTANNSAKLCEKIGRFPGSLFHHNRHIRAHRIFSCDQNKSFNWRLESKDWYICYGRVNGWLPGLGMI